METLNALLGSITSIQKKDLRYIAQWIVQT